MMRMMMSSILLVIVTSAALGVSGANEPENSEMLPAERSVELWPAARRRDLGQTEKFRILVDKVITKPGPGEDTWRVMTDDRVRQIVQAGFNVVVPRVGGEDLDRVRAVAQCAGKQGIYSISWLRGTLHLYDKGERWDRQRMTWQSGFAQDFYSPNADKLWDRLTEQVVGCANISVEEPALIGVFLDYENYWDKGRKGIDVPRKETAYDLSYDLKILGEFAAAREIKIPDLKPTERYPWLVEHDLHDSFATFQINSWRARCRKLRQQVDAINPQFQFFIYPTPMESLFIEKAVCTEWATPAAPVVIADWRTYGRPQPKVLSQAQALSANRNRLKNNLQAMRANDVPFRYISGIDPMAGGYTPGVIPALTNTDPEFCGRSAVMISQMSDGYWVFYEGPTRGKPDHQAYMRWFTRANRAIVTGNYGFWQEKRQTPDIIKFRELKPKTNGSQVAGNSVMFGNRKMIEQTGRFEVHPIEGASLKYLRQFDIVALMSYTLSLDVDDPFSQNLRKYVEQGGGLLLGFDTVWFTKISFPEIAVHDQPAHDKVEVEVGRHAHVIDTDLEIVQNHAALGDLQPGDRFRPTWHEHMAFKAGPNGTVVIRNEFGDPAYVVGKLGKGRVVFAGAYYDKKVEGMEEQVLLAMFDWLAGAEGAVHTAQ